MTRDELINRIQIKMNEISPFDSGDIVNNTYVDSLLPESTRTILLSAPVYMVPVTEKNDIKPEPYGDKSGYIELPQDFLRFIEFKMSDWRKSVVRAITEGSNLYSMQKNTYTRGDYMNPAVALVADRILEYYSIKDSHDIDYFKYVADEKPENLTNKKLLDAITWQCAGDCFVSLSEVELSKVAFQKATEHLQ